MQIATRRSAARWMHNVNVEFPNRRIERVAIGVEHDAMDARKSCLTVEELCAHVIGVRRRIRNAVADEADSDVRRFIRALGRAYLAPDPSDSARRRRAERPDDRSAHGHAAAR